jgi:uncharacterized repeat protein (TIGR01451 family)
LPTSSTATSTNDDNVDGDDNGSQVDTDGDGVTDGTIISPTITLAAGTEPVGEAGIGGAQDDADDANGDMTIDFGLVPVVELLSIGSTIFSDDNDNGIQDAGELNIGAKGKIVAIQLIDASTGAVIATTSTDANGNYFFGGLEEGDYIVQFEPPSSLPISSSVTSSNDDNVDGDDNGSQVDTDGDGVTDGTITSPTITLIAGTEPTGESGTGGAQDDADDANGDMTIDFGILPAEELLSIGSTIFSDDNNNGIQDAGEVTVGALGKSILIELVDASTGLVITTTTTDANGNYIFDGLSEGNYIVQFHPPSSLPIASTPTSTVDDNVDGDNNGSQADTDGNGVTDGQITSPVITLVAGTEPVGESGIGGAQDDADDANGNMTVDFGLQPSIYDLAIAKNITSAMPYMQGSPVSYEITVTNQGNQDAGNITFVDNPSVGLTYLNSNATGNIVETSPMTFQVSSLPVGASATVELTFLIDANFMGTSISNVAMITTDDGDDIDSDPSTGIGVDEDTDGNSQDDDEDVEMIPVGQVYDLALSKALTGSGSYSIGSSVFYDIIVSNQGSLDATNVIVEDTPDAGLTYVGSSASANVVETSSLTYAVSSLPSGSSEVITVEFVIDDNFSGTTLANNAEITSDDGDDFDSNPDTGNGVDEDGDGSGDDDDEDSASLEVEYLSIGSSIFSDDNNNGIQDQGELSVAEKGKTITLELIDANTGSVVATTATDANGEFLFDGLAPGDYIVQFHPPSSLPMSSTPTSTSDDDVDGDDNGIQMDTNGSGLTDGLISSPVITLSLGDEPMNEPNNDGGMSPQDDANGNLTIDFGLVPLENILASLGNNVWLDANGNGVQDFGEEGIEGVTVLLYNDLGVLVAVALTDSNGMYLFDGLTPGEYYIEFQAPDGLELTTPNAGSNDTSDSDVDGSNGPNTTQSTELSLGENDTSWDAGFYSCIPLGDLVWYDAINNDVFDTGENGVNGIKVEVYQLQANGSYELYDVQFTGHKPGTPSDDGYWKMCVPPGTYFVKYAVPPIGLVLVRPNSGFNELADSDVTGANGVNTTSSFRVISGDEMCDIGAGFEPMASLGDRVWFDNNANGTADVNDEGLEGITVEVYDLFGQLIETTVTDEDGLYNVDYLQEGSYYVEFVYPNNLLPTTSNVGDDATDSDLDNSFGPGTTGLYSVGTGEHLPNIDAGFRSSSILAIDNISIKAYRDGDQNTVEWAVEDESTVDYYRLERSFGNEFSQIEITDANGVDQSTYVEVDEDSQAGGTYLYRVIAVEFNGEETYSEIVQIDVDDSSLGEDITLTPNPAKEMVSIDMTINTKTESAILDVLDASGRLIISNYILDRNLEIGQHIFALDITDFDGGVYYLNITTDAGVTAKKLIVVK